MWPNPHRPSSGPRKSRSARAPKFLEQLESRVLLTTYNFAPLALFSGGGKNGTGAAPQGLTMAPNGDLYGTAAGGGQHGYGLIFKIAANTDTIIPLASFSGPDGIYPRGGLVVDAQGNVFGTTAAGGTTGAGTLFEYSASANAIETLVNFTGPNGAFPLAGISTDGAGNLFGITDGQRAGGRNKSTIFEYNISTSTLTTLATLALNLDPRSTPVIDSNGNLFGTTRHGGKNDGGTLFELVHGAGTITTLASFTGPNGQFPDGGLLMDSQGDIFGITNNGGSHGNGAAFEWSPSSSTLTLLASFTNAIGIRPLGNLVMDSGGNLFGVTALGGGHAGGSVFELTPAGTASTLTQLYAFQGTKNGRTPSGPIILDPTTGDLIGETFSGGSTIGNVTNRGTVFDLIPSANPQSPIKIVVTQSPRSTIAGHTLAPDVTVEIEDIFGNIVTTDNGTVTLQINSGPTTSTLTGVVTVNFVNGVATFPGISIDTAGNYTLSATDGTRTSTPTKSFTISPDTNATPVLVFSQEPNGTTSHNTSLTPPLAVSVEDEFGNVITTLNPTVTLAINTGPNGGAINGPKSLGAIHGKVTFTGLSLTVAGTYTFTASAPNFSPVTSDPIVIT